MEIYKISMLAVLLAVVVLSGCSQPVDTTSTKPVCADSLDKMITMDIAQQILLEMNFVIEKYDTEKGVIITRPLRGSQFFEFWRNDNAGADSYSQANLHSLMRTVYVDVTEKFGMACLTCQVGVKRLSIPERPIDRLSRTSSVFTGGNSSMQRLELKGDFDWIDMPDDKALAAKILQLTGDRIAKLEGKI